MKRISIYMVLFCLAMLSYRCETGTEYERDEDYNDREIDTGRNRDVDKDRQSEKERERNGNRPWENDEGIDKMSALSNAPSAAVDHFEKNNPNTNNVRWYKANDRYAVNYESGGGRYTAEYDMEGNWQETRKEIEWDDAPNSVREAYSPDRNNNGWMAYRVYEVERPDRDGKFYSVQLRKEVYLDEEGKVMDQREVESQ